MKKIFFFYVGMLSVLTADTSAYIYVFFKWIKFCFTVYKMHVLKCTVILHFKSIKAINDINTSK